MKYQRLKIIDIFLILCLFYVIYSVRVEKSPILLSEFQYDNKLNFLLTLEESKIQSFILIDYFLYRNYNKEVSISL